MIYDNILSVAAGGFIGSISRYALNNWMLKKTKTPFPLGTIIINIAGSLFLGSLAAFNAQSQIDPVMYLLFTAGFAGAFTTFSTAMYEFYQLIEGRKFKLAFYYFIYTMAGGIAASIIGYWSTLLII